MSDTDPIRVCHFIPSLHPGGAENVLLSLVENSSDPGVSYTVCHLLSADGLADELREAGATVVGFGGSSPFDPRAILRAYNHFHSTEYDVLHCHLPPIYHLGRTMARLSGIDSVVSTHHAVADNYHPVFRALERRTRRFDDLTIAYTQSAKETFDIRPGDQWDVVYNGIDVNGFRSNVENADPQAVRDRRGIDEDDLVFVNVARYAESKSQTDIVEAMDTVIDQVPEAKLLLVGSGGPLEDDLRNQVTELGLEDNVFVTGYVDSVYDYYAIADAFVVTYADTVRGFGVVILEAMASELPVVATDTPGVRRVVDDGVMGYTVPPHDSDQLADRLIELSSDDRRETMGENGYEMVSETYDVDRMVGRYESSYRDLSS